jgi:acetyl-CoA carboxylase biotin carboxyl carrier protein
LSEKRNSRKSSGGEKTEPAAASPMDVGLLARLVELMTRHDLNTVDVRDGARRVILKRGPAGGTPMLVHPPANSVPVHQALPPASAAAPSPAGAEDESRFHRIVSPMVGTFYAAPKPGEKPFVTVGAAVTEDTDVCIIEAMKTFNNIKAECRGTIARVVAQDGQPVEFGAVLFLVKPG